MGDLVKPVGQWISNNIPLSIGIALFIFCIFFEISKIKVYPLKWLWKLISWPFRKIDEQRTNSFKNIIISFQSEMETKLDSVTASLDTRFNDVSITFDNKLNELSTVQNNNCAAVKSCFTELEKRFDALDAKQSDTEIRLNEIDKKQDMQTADRIRAHVLNFAEDLRRGNLRTLEDFNVIMKEDENYEEIMKRYEIKNNVYFHAIKFINKKYDEFTETDGFAKY